MCIRDSYKRISIGVYTTDCPLSDAGFFIVSAVSVLTSAFSDASVAVSASVSYTHLDVYKRQVQHFYTSSSILLDVNKESVLEYVPLFV